jgi:prepilin-type N-terminal cleavage/methylation domain-containing protein
MKNTATAIHRRPQAGFTLIEILVVITIVIVLAALTATWTVNIKRSAAATRSVSQMRQISVAVATYAADNSMPDYFYVSTPVADYWNEAGTGAKYTPGNPARVLYNAEEPESGIIQDHSVFFSPLVDMEVPDKLKYNPAAANSANPWGTFAWFYPFVGDSSKFQGAQSGHARVVSGEAVNPRIEGRYMMSESYPSITGPKYGKKIYHALMSDGSIQYVADSLASYEKWRRGK